MTELILPDLLGQPEGRRLEFKRELPGKADLCKTIVAFANDAGGSLILGVQDRPRQSIGIPEDELMAIEERISQLIFDGCTPIISPEMTVLNDEGRYLLKVTIWRGSNPPYYLKSKGKLDGTYVRVGSTNRPASEEMIVELERLKRNVSFDGEILPDIAWTELMLERLYELYLEKTGTACDASSLTKLHLLKTSPYGLHPTNALLLLSDDAQKSACFPYAKIECGRFKGTTVDTFIDRKTLDGNLLDQAEQAYEFVLRHINQAAVTEGMYTRTRWQYPIKAIREAIRNAVIHRDYSLSGKDIKIAIYDDMVEITSPGKLPPSVDFSRLEARQSDIRNKVIAPFFRHLGLIDQWGNGLKLIADELKAYPEIELNWAEVGFQFQVQFVHKSVQVEAQVEAQVALTNTDKAILACLAKGPQAGGQLAKRLGYSQRTGNFKKSVSRLMDAGLIVYTIPDKPNSRLQQYRLTDIGASILEEQGRQ